MDYSAQPTPENLQGESDFLVYLPEYGIILDIEVKSGHDGKTLHDGLWQGWKTLVELHRLGTTGKGISGFDELRFGFAFLSCGAGDIKENDLELAWEKVRTHTMAKVLTDLLAIVKPNAAQASAISAFANISALLTRIVNPTILCLKSGSDLKIWLKHLATTWGGGDPIETGDDEAEARDAAARPSFFVPKFSCPFRQRLFSSGARLPAPSQSQRIMCCRPS